MEAGDRNSWGACVKSISTLTCEIPQALGTVIEGDAHAVAYDGMDDSAAGGEVYQASARDIGIDMRAIECDALIVSDAGDLQVLDVDGNHCTCVAPAFIGREGDDYGPCAGAGAGT